MTDEQIWEAAVRAGYDYGALERLKEMAHSQSLKTRIDILAWRRCQREEYRDDY